MSVAIQSEARYTSEELLALPDGDLYELVDGHLEERHVSGLSSFVGLKIGRLIMAHCEAGNLGWAFGADLGYRCFPSRPDTVRKPDASFIRQDRLTAEGLEEGFLGIAPDLAVEVVSPNDLAYEIERKVQDYLAAGVRLVWVVVPPSRTVRIARADGTFALLGAEDRLSGEDVLPGFECRVGDLFPPDRTTAPTS